MNCSRQDTQPLTCSWSHGICGWSIWIFGQCWCYWRGVGDGHCVAMLCHKSHLPFISPGLKVVFAYTASYGGVADVIEYYTSIPSSGFDGRKVAGAAAENDSLQLYSGVWRLPSSSQVYTIILGFWCLNLFQSQNWICDFLINQPVVNWYNNVWNSTQIVAQHHFLHPSNWTVWHSFNFLPDY